MSSAFYEVKIVLGGTVSGETWTITHEENDPRDKIPDNFEILAGLTFGWTMPDSQLWPLQPNPMTASLALNLPEFGPYGAGASIAVGTRVAIEVTLDPVAGVAFAFYGRITDSQATPRVGRPGVTLSLMAVDYTIDIVEYGAADLGNVNSNDDAALAALWASNPLYGTFPAWETDPSAVSVPDTAGVNARELVDQILLATTDLLVEIPPELVLPTDPDDPPGPDTTQGPARLMLAPVISSALLHPPNTGKLWAFDLLWQVPRTPGYAIDADKLERGTMTWARNKRAAPNLVTANGPGPITYTASHVSGGRAYGPDIVETINAVSASLTRLSELAQFYLPDTTPTRRGWNLPTLRWLLSRENPTVLGDLPLDLMPRWKAAEGDYSRSSCYGRLVSLVGVLPDVNPYHGTGHDELIGLLGSCQLTIAGGHMVLDLGFRELQRGTPTGLEAGGFVMGGYAGAAYAELAPVP